MSSRRSQAGLSLIEVVVFIIVIGIAFSAMLVLYNQVTQASVDPLLRKQTLAIASSLLEEIELKPFTNCDPDDVNVYTPGAVCTTAEVLPGCGVAPANEQAETRYSAAAPFDNVNDYNCFEMGSGTTSPGIKTVDSDGTLATSIADLADYAVRVSIRELGAGELAAIGTAADGLNIKVTAQHVPSGTTVILEGYRLRYAPNSP